MYAVQLIGKKNFLFYLYDVHLKAFTFDIFDKPILQAQQKKSLQM